MTVYWQNDWSTCLLSEADAEDLKRAYCGASEQTFALQTTEGNRLIIRAKNITALLTLGG